MYRDLKGALLRIFWKAYPAHIRVLRSLPILRTNRPCGDPPLTHIPCYTWAPTSSYVSQVPWKSLPLQHRTTFRVEYTASCKGVHYLNYEFLYILSIFNQLITQAFQSKNACHEKPRISAGLHCGALGFHFPWAQRTVSLGKFTPNPWMQLTLRTAPEENEVAFSSSPATSSSVWMYSLSSGSQKGGAIK